MKKLLVYLKDYKKESILGPLFKLLEASFELLVPLVVTKIIDVGIATGDVHYIVRMVLLMVGLALIGLICSITAQYFAAKAAVGFAAGLKSALFRHIQSLSYSEMDHLGTASLITRMTSDVNQLQSGVNLVLRLFLRSPFIVFGAMVMAFTIDVRSALVFAVAIPLLSVVVFGIMLLTMPLYRRAQAGLDRLLRRTRENLSGVRVIRAFHKEAEETAQFAEENESLTRLQLFVGRISALMNPLTYVLINSAIVALIWTGAWQVERGALTQGQVVALVNYMSQILVELIKLANLIITITKAAACARRIESVFDENSSMTFPEKPAQDDPAAQDAVVFENVALRYGNAGAESLSGLSFRVRRGQTVGIIGGTGSGKSSLVNLIPRFYDATAGRILVDGVDITNVPANERGLGFVFQNYALFPHMTIFDNVAYGLKIRGESKDTMATKVREALALVGLTKAEQRYPSQLSGGEQQRVALARVLVLRPKLLLMDEPLSNLDAKLRLHMRTEIRRIQQKLGITCLYVTHDQKEALTMSDRIMVMHGGKIEQIGTPMQLYEDPATPFVADFIGQANLIEGCLEAVQADGYGIISVSGQKLRARMGKQNPPAVGENAYLVVRPENLHLQAGSESFTVQIVNRLFEGDRIDYHVQIPNSNQTKPYSMSVPFLPGTGLIDVGTELKATFTPDAGVIIKR